MQTSEIVTQVITKNSLGFYKKPKNTRVVVAMSGGVDSSVVAAKLKQENYDVIGVTMQLYDHGKALEKKGACCAGIDINDARRVAQELNFPHYVLDYEDQFKESVIEEFADSYLDGLTPVPCIRCNERVKFVDLLKMAKELNADCLATGHYIKRVEGVHGPELHRALDNAKDQSYFLFTTTKKQLEFLRFPLGNIPTKGKTRELAEKYGLKVAKKPDSQDICFVPNGSYSDVIRKLRPDADSPGDIINLQGEILGKHNGIINFTVGQRRGLGIGGGEPLYVIKLDPKNKTVSVGPKTALIKKKLNIDNINWLGDKPFEQSPKKGWELLVKVRSTQAPKKALIIPLCQKSATVELLEVDQAISPGQACVFYADNSERVLGGGWITKN